MSGAKHTPGPWVIYLDAGVAASVMPAGRDGDVCTMAEEYRTMIEVNANAALIAAAPDLLAACEALITYVPEAPGVDHAVRRIAAAAIAKARGTT